MPITQALLQKIQIPEVGRLADYVIQNNRNISPKFLSREFLTMQNRYADRYYNTFCHDADVMGKCLERGKNPELPGIIYSAMCKLTEYFPHQLEYFAKKGYQVAERNGDYIHMMARLNDLHNVYRNNPNKLMQYIDVLYGQERCLKELCYNYDNAISTFRSVTRQPAPRESYYLILANTQTELAKLIRRKHPDQAERKLLSARNIYSRDKIESPKKNQASIKYIDQLLHKIELVRLIKES